MEVLFVCTGNICRSPMAEALLRRRLEPCGDAVRVSSVGTAAVGGPASAHAIAAMAERGLDLSGHRSRPLTSVAVGSARLVLTMERAHVREVCAVAGEAWPRTFTLKELARRASGFPARRAAQPLESWLAEVGSGRRRADLLGTDPGDDVDDPVGQSLDRFRAVADELDALLGAVVAAAWPELARGAA